MKTLVTGGTGFVGSHLIEHLHTGGDQVRALVRPGSNADFARSLGADVVTGDLDDRDSLDAACAGCDVVYHAAAKVEIVGREDDFQRTTVGGTERLVEAARTAGIRRFVYVSSCGIYHPRLLSSGRVIDESTPTPEPPRWFRYGRAKFRAENVVRRGVRPPGEWVIVRLGYLYGPRNRTMKTYLDVLFRNNIMMIIGDGCNEMALIDVGDAVRAIALAGRCPDAAGKVLIASGDERVTQRQYFDALADGFGVPRIKRSIPYRVAYLFGWLGEYIAVGPRRSLVRRSAVVLTGLPQRLRCDNTRRLLGWKPQVRFADGIRRAFDWYRSEYNDAGLPALTENR
ncbi:MAG: NAD-dependent epimerase/dehydratase family protein [Phycisphaerae bacterium]